MITGFLVASLVALFAIKGHRSSFGEGPARGGAPRSPARLQARRDLGNDWSNSLLSGLAVRCSAPAPWAC
ncbi:MAG: hypothetical protein IPF57_18030 [Gammaproteobacteria bacterium]|nr:hypothetical protein [Gammaproteobacteria bacterium]